jgi:hypothetical protein
MSVRRAGILRTHISSSTKMVVESIMDKLQQQTRPKSVNYSKSYADKTKRGDDKLSSTESDIETLLATILSRDFNRKIYGELDEIKSKMIQILINPEGGGQSGVRPDDASGYTQSHREQKNKDSGRLHALNQGVMLADWIRKPSNFPALKNLVRRRISEILANVVACVLPVVRNL